MSDEPQHPPGVNLPSQRVTRAAEWVLILVFSAAITFPGAWAVRDAGRERVDASEKRKLAAAPQWGWNRLEYLPAEIDAYFNDRIGLRRTFILLHNYCLWLSGTSTNPAVVIGRDNWLYHNGNSDFEDYYGRNPIRPDRRELLKKTLEQRRTWLNQFGIKYLLFIAPNKQTIHPEYMPGAALQRRGARTNFDEFLEILPSDMQANFLDLREPLREAARSRIVYFPQDAHWNDLGRRVAYHKIYERCRQWFSEEQLGPELEFSERTVVSTWKCDLRGMLGVPDGEQRDIVLEPKAGGIQKLVSIHPGKQAGPVTYESYFESPRRPLRVVMFGDSFLWSGDFQVWLASHFGKAWTIHKKEVGHDSELIKLVEAVKPDLVI